MDTSGVTTLKTLVQTIIFESGYAEEDWPFVYQFTINAIRNVHMFHTLKYKISKMDMDTQTNTISWPDDYIGLVFLGIPQNGIIWTLTRDNKMIYTTTLVNGQETLDSNAGEGVIESEGIVWGYNAKGGQNSLYYTEDENNRRFSINGIKPVANILMGYVSSGIEDKDTLIPIKFKEVAKMFIRWHMNLKEPINKNNADYFKDLYEQEANKLKAFEDPTLDEIYDALLKMSTQTVIR